MSESANLTEENSYPKIEIANFAVDLGSNVDVEKKASFEKEQTRKEYDERGLVIFNNRSDEIEFSENLVTEGDVFAENIKEEIDIIEHTFNDEVVLTENVELKAEVLDPLSIDLETTSSEPNTVNIEDAVESIKGDERQSSSSASNAFENSFADSIKQLTDSKVIINENLTGQKYPNNGNEENSQKIEGEVIDVIDVDEEQNIKNEENLVLVFEEGEDQKYVPEETNNTDNTHNCPATILRLDTCTSKFSIFSYNDVVALTEHIMKHTSIINDTTRDKKHLQKLQSLSGTIDDLRCPIVYCSRKLKKKDGRRRHYIVEHKLESLCLILSDKNSNESMNLLSDIVSVVPTKVQSLVNKYNERGTDIYREYMGEFEEIHGRNGDVIEKILNERKKKKNYLTKSSNSKVRQPETSNQSNKTNNVTPTILHVETVREGTDELSSKNKKIVESNPTSALTDSESIFYRKNTFKCITCPEKRNFTKLEDIGDHVNNSELINHGILCVQCNEVYTLEKGSIYEIQNLAYFQVHIFSRNHIKNIMKNNKLGLTTSETSSPTFTSIPNNCEVCHCVEEIELCPRTDHYKHISTETHQKNSKLLTAFLDYCQLRNCYPIADEKGAIRREEITFFFKTLQCFLTDGLKVRKKVADILKKYIAYVIDDSRGTKVSDLKVWLDSVNYYYYKTTTTAKLSVLPPEAIAVCFACNLNCIFSQYKSVVAHFQSHRHLNCNANDQSAPTAKCLKCNTFVVNFLYESHLSNCHEEVRENIKEAYQNLNQKSIDTFPSVVSDLTNISNSEGNFGKRSKDNHIRNYVISSKEKKDTTSALITNKDAPSLSIVSKDEDTSSLPFTRKDTSSSSISKRVNETRKAPIVSGCSRTKVKSKNMFDVVLLDEDDTDEEDIDNPSWKVDEEDVDELDAVSSCSARDSVVSTETFETFDDIFIEQKENEGGKEKSEIQEILLENETNSNLSSLTTEKFNNLDDVLSVSSKESTKRKYEEVSEETGNNKRKETLEYYYFCLDCEKHSSNDSNVGCRVPIGIDIAQHFAETGHENLESLNEIVLPIKQKKLLKIQNISYSSKWGDRVRKCYKKLILSGNICIYVGFS